jgi:hypothetical protein
MISRHRENAGVSQQLTSSIGVTLPIHHVANRHRDIHLQHGKVLQRRG